MIHSALSKEQRFIKRTTFKDQFYNRIVSFKLKKIKQEFRLNRNSFDFFYRKINGFFSRFSLSLDTYVKMDFIGEVRAFHALLLCKFFHFALLFKFPISLRSLRSKESPYGPNLPKLEYIS